MPDQGSFQNQPDNNERIENPSKNWGEKAISTAKSALKLATTFLPYGRVFRIAIIILVLLLVVAVGSAFGLILGIGGGNDPRSTGASAHQEYSDTELIRKVLALNGNKETIRQFIIESTPGLIEELDDLEQGAEALPQERQEHPTVQNLLKTVENSKALINQLPNDVRSQTVDEIRQNLQKIVNLSLTSFINNLTSQELAKTVLDHPKIKGRDNDRIGFKHDVSNLLLDRKIMELMLRLANEGGFEFYVCASRTNHSEFVKGTNRRSDHFFGMAIDICKINGQAVRNSSEKTGQLMKWIVDNKDDLKEASLFPKQVIGPVEFKQWNVNRGKAGARYSSKTLKSHADHIHIGLYK